MMRLILNVPGIWWVKARREDSLGCRQALVWLRSLSANVKPSSDFLLWSCGPAAASLQMSKSKRGGEKAPFLKALSALLALLLMG